MALYFSRTRYSLPQDLVALNAYMVPGERVLDLGCGNGRFSTLVAAEDYVGADISQELIRQAQAAHPDKRFVLVEPLNLPFEDALFDKVFCLAVIHHVPSENLRLRFLGEIRRILKPGGELILTAWYLLHKPNVRAALVKTAVARLVGLGDLDPGDSFIPFKDPGGVVLADRYVHAFSLRELEALVEAAGFEMLSAGLVRRGRNRNIQIIARQPGLPEAADGGP